MHNHWEEEPLGDRMHTYSGWCVQSRRPVKTGRRQLEMRVQRPADLGGFLLCKKTALGKFVSFLWLPELDEATVTLFKLYYPKDPRPWGTDKLTKTEEWELEIGQHLWGQLKIWSRQSEKNPKKVWLEIYKNNLKCILAPEADRGASKRRARLVELVRSQGTGLGGIFRFGTEEVTVISSTQVILTQVS